MRLVGLALGLVLVVGVVAFGGAYQATGRSEPRYAISTHDPGPFVGTYVVDLPFGDGEGRLKITEVEDPRSPAFPLGGGIAGVEVGDTPFVLLEVWTSPEPEDEKPDYAMCGCFVRSERSTYFVGVDREVWYLAAMTMKSAPLWRTLRITVSDDGGFRYESSPVAVVWTGVRMAGRFEFDPSRLPSGEEVAARWDGILDGSVDMNEDGWFAQVASIRDAVAYYDTLPGEAWRGGLCRPVDVEDDD